MWYTCSSENNLKGYLLTSKYIHISKHQVVMYRIQLTEAWWIWHHGTWWTSVQKIAYWLEAPNHKKTILTNHQRGPMTIPCRKYNRKHSRCHSNAINNFHIWNYCQITKWLWVTYFWNLWYHTLACRTMEWMHWMNKIWQNDVKAWKKHFCASMWVIMLF